MAARPLRPLPRLRPVRDAVFGLFAQTWISYRASPAVSVHRVRRPRPGDRAPHTAATRALHHHLAHACSLTELHTVTAYLDRLYHRK